MISRGGDLSDSAPGRSRLEVAETYNYPAVSSESDTHRDSPITTVPRNQS